MKHSEKPKAEWFSPVRKEYYQKGLEETLGNYNFDEKNFFEIEAIIKVAINKEVTPKQVLQIIEKQNKPREVHQLVRNILYKVQYNIKKLPYEVFPEQYSHFIN